jgi:hypothetical protein
MGAIAALMWCNLTAKADTHWRKRWFHHLLGDESEVLLRRSMFHEEDAVVRLLIVQKQVKQEKICHLLSNLLNYRHIKLCHCIVD